MADEEVGDLYSLPISKGFPTTKCTEHYLLDIVDDLEVPLGCPDGRESIINHPLRTYK